MWSNDDVIFMKIISKFTKGLFVLNYNHKIKAWVLSEKSYGNDVVLIKKIFPFIKTLCIDNLWLSKIRIHHCFVMGMWI